MKTRNFVIAAIILMIAWLVVWHLMWQEPAKMAHEVAEELKSVFNVTPIISVNHRIVIAESHPFADLALVSKSVSLDTKFVSTWLHSTKDISVHGEFLAKAGFDLNSLFAVNLTTKPPGVTVVLPAPKILSLEMTASEITDEHGGLINWLYPQDHEAALKQMRAEAAAEIAKSTLLNTAKEEIEKRIRALNSLQNIPVAIKYAADTETPLKTGI